MPDLLVTRRASAAAKTEQGLEGGPWFPATVGPEDELIEVNRELARAYSVVGSHQPVLKVTDHPVGQRNNGLDALAQSATGRLRSWDMRVAGRGESVEALEAVGVDRGTDRDVPGYEVPHRRPSEVTNDLHS